MTWPILPLGDVASFAMGQAPPSADTNIDGIGVPFYRSGEFGDLRPITRIWTSNPLRTATTADVLVCVVGANSGEVNLGAEGAIGRSVAAITPGQLLNQRFLFHFLTSLTERLRRGAQGSAQGVITKTALAEIPVPIPPLDEQHRIVDLLEDQLPRLDAGVQAISRSQRRLITLRDSALAAAVDRAATSGGVRMTSIGELAKVSSGMTPLKANKGFYENGTIPWITSGDLHQGVITAATRFVTQAALDETTLKVVPAGTLLVAMYGEGRTRGTAAELGIDAATNQACAAIQLHDASLRPWVRLVLDANYSKVRRLAAGGVQPNLNLSMVKAVAIPLPSVECQSTLLDEQNELAEAIKRFTAELAAARRHASGLRRALLAAAFSGRLTSASAVSDVEEKMGA